jgi:transposase InsO family protein
MGTIVPLAVSADGSTFFDGLSVGNAIGIVDQPRLPRFKPTDTSFIEAFDSKFQAECLNAHWFMSLADTREKLDAWCRDYNEVRPHIAIGYNVAFAMHCPDGVTSPPS